MQLILQGSGFVTSTHQDLGAALGKIADAIDKYFISFSECLHGMKPSICNHCNAIPRNHPSRWGFSQFATPAENQEAYDYHQSKLMQWIIKQQQEIMIAKQELGYDQPAMLVDRRPLRFGGPDKTQSDIKAYGSARERMKFKHEENGEIRKFYGHNERTFDRQRRRYHLTPAHQLTAAPKGGHVPK